MLRSDAGSAVAGAGARIALLIIDMQNAFFEDEALAGQQQDIVAACNGLIEAAHGAQAPVLMALTEHLQDGSTWTRSMLDDGQGFIFRGTRQADVVAGLHVEEVDVVTKVRDSAFFGTDLAARLRGLGVDHLVLAGVSTHSCVAQTGADAFAHDFQVSYARDAMGSTNQQYADAMLEILSDSYRQPVVGQAEAEALFA
ncbi:cysteine hydrolase [Arthrobacter pityocampae]|uniref:Cysteine hydrolase n=1 Tax=Arthrobacter pityocampae TaxID=547334 RepID=A0A2S5IVR1_9MICC|nr:isochorismatase family cysteine hydrolase [Arthrobacter pityocampae]PPB48626.1 cysteine hydrolase [Arthrobacter pityocampae]